MRNMLQERQLVSQRNVIEQNEVLMHLPHVPYVRNYGKREFLCKETDGEKLTDTRQPGAVSLYIVQGRSLHKILEHHSIRNMLARRDLDRSNFARQHSVSMNVVRMCGLFDPGRPVHGEFPRHPDSDWKIPALVGVEHESAGLPDAFPKRLSSP